MNALVWEVIRACFSDAPREEEGEQGEEKKQRWQVSRCDLNKCTFCEQRERERRRRRRRGNDEATALFIVVISARFSEYHERKKEK
jgi:hypothetical protein